MTLNTVEDLIVGPTMMHLGEPYDSDKAWVLLVAIGLQESGFRTRRQGGGGPARGFWQFEKGGGCAEFAAARRLGKFRDVARGLYFPTDAAATYAAIGAGADVLACLMARAVLWLDPAKLPEIGEEEEAWEYYLRRWRPGKPHRARWAASYAAAQRQA